MSNMKIECFRHCLIDQLARQTKLLHELLFEPRRKSDLLQCVTCFRPPECHRDGEAGAHYAGGGRGVGQLELFICEQM